MSLAVEDLDLSQRALFRAETKSVGYEADTAPTPTEQAAARDNIYAQKRPELTGGTFYGHGSGPTITATSGAVGVGLGAIIDGSGISIGNGSIAYGAQGDSHGGIAIGAGSRADDNAIAIGNGANTHGKIHCIAIGKDALTGGGPGAHGAGYFTLAPNGYSQGAWILGTRYDGNDRFANQLLAPDDDSGAMLWADGGETLAPAMGELVRSALTFAYSPGIGSHGGIKFYYNDTGIIKVGQIELAPT